MIHFPECSSFLLSCLLPHLFKVFIQATTFLTAHAEEGGGTDGILEYVPKEKVTLPKTNMAPENRPLEKELPIGNHHFQGQTVSFRECKFRESSKRPSILGFHCSLQGPSWWVLLLLGLWWKKDIGEFPSTYHNKESILDSNLYGDGHLEYFEPCVCMFWIFILIHRHRYTSSFSLAKNVFSYLPALHPCKGKCARDPSTQQPNGLYTRTCFFFDRLLWTNSSLPLKIGLNAPKMKGSFPKHPISGGAELLVF